MIRRQLSRLVSGLLVEYGVLRRLWSEIQNRLAIDLFASIAPLCRIRRTREAKAKRPGTRCSYELLYFCVRSFRSTSARWRVFSVGKTPTAIQETDELIALQ